jgi:hypothetical protein
MGASFAEESGLEMAPPLAGQAGFLESLDSIDEMQFREALRKLEQRRAPAAAPTQAPAPAQAQAQAANEPASSATADALAAEPSNPPRQARTPARASSAAPADGLLLKDATLEDIVRHLQERNIEPSFRFLTPR